MFVPSNQFSGFLKTNHADVTESRALLTALNFGRGEKISRSESRLFCRNFRRLVTGSKKLRRSSTITPSLAIDTP